jgi:hypothetical protein
LEGKFEKNEIKIIKRPGKKKQNQKSERRRRSGKVIRIKKKKKTNSTICQAQCRAKIGVDIFPVDLNRKK